MSEGDSTDKSSQHDTHFPKLYRTTTLEYINVFMVHQRLNWLNQVTGERANLVIMAVRVLPWLTCDNLR